MTEQVKTCGFVAVAIISVLFLTAGCAQRAEETAGTRVETPEPTITKVELAEQKPTVRLTLKFASDDLTTYKVTTETERGIAWEGPLLGKPSGFTGGHTGNRIEITFAQQIESIDDKGNAVAEITIKGLKYLARVKDNIVLDFESSREKDQNSPLAKLIGQSYTIEITPAGQVSRIIDVRGAQDAVRGSSSANQTALKLLSADAIKARHTIQALPAAGKEQLRTDESWSDVKTFSFDMMGSKSYEKIYTLKEIKDIDNRRIAIAQMDAIPSAEKAAELHKEQAESVFSKLFDNTETYTGRLKLDLTAGKVEEYREKLLTEWLMVEPNPKNAEQPDALRMTAIRLHSIERIDGS